MIRRLFLDSETEWRRELDLVGADPAGWERFASRADLVVMKTGPLSPPAANILKQCMLSSGGDAMVARGAVCCSCDRTDAILVGMPRHFRLAAKSLEGQPFGLAGLAAAVEAALSPPDLPSEIPLRHGALRFGGAPLLMGILNVTPDSFSDGGLYVEPRRAVERALEMRDQGAAVVDVGAESTRPGSIPVGAAVQIERILPVIRGIRSADPGLPLSVDTSSAEVARAALLEGADMINDVTALGESAMARLAAAEGVPVVLMHMKGVPATMQDAPWYDDALGEVYSFLEERVSAALAAGVPRDRILVDPGLGFGKRLEDNLLLVRRAAEFRGTGCRTVLGYSRKRFIGELTGIAEPAGRDEAGIAVAAISCGKVDVLRVHDVARTAAAVHVAHAVIGGVG